jgi:glyoxylase-like metal-dependent hydrolase (beta-lactamase superfamily II)
MNLEDHIGDIIRKGRMIADISAAAAAKAAGISESTLATLEETGKPLEGMRWEKLGSLLGMDAAKLEAIASGWHPKIPDLARWRHLRQISTDQGGNTVHCYVIWDDATKQAAIFDTGWDAGPIIELIKSHGLEPRHLFITHTHHDHIAGMKDLHSRFPNLLVHTDAHGATAEQRNRRDDCVELGALRVTNRATPGHAEDGVTYLVDGWPGGSPPVAVVGDTIFAGSMGRGFQSWDLARGKVTQEILSLNPETLLCPGHGPLTTVAEEHAHNPFF